jgi:hypothetical protein
MRASFESKMTLREFTVRAGGPEAKLMLPQRLTIGSSDRGCRLRWAKEGNR